MCVGEGKGWLVCNCLIYKSPCTQCMVWLPIHLAKFGTFKGVPYMVPFNGCQISPSLSVKNWHPFEGPGIFRQVYSTID